MRVPALLTLPAAFLLLPAEVTSQEGKPRDERDKLRGVLAPLERQVWEALAAREREPLLNLLAPDYRQVGGPGGPRATREELLKLLPELRLANYTVDEMQVVPLGPDAALLTYRVRLAGRVRGRPITPAAYEVASTWVRRGGKWFNVFRQWTPDPAVVPPPPVVSAFEISTIPGALLYTYKGKATLLDVQAGITLKPQNGLAARVDRYFATWEPGGVKEFELNLVTLGVAEVERIDLNGRATMDGQPVLLRAVSRREGYTAPAEKAVPKPPPPKVPAPPKVPEGANVPVPTAPPTPALPAIPAIPPCPPVPVCPPYPPCR